MCRAAFLALPLAFALASCGVRLRDESLLNRCGDLMRQAFPGGDIEVTRTSLAPQATRSLATSIVTAEGRRRDLGPGTIPLREIAVECRFDEGILTGFRWTKGPLR